MSQSCKRPSMKWNGLKIKFDHPHLSYGYITNTRGADGMELDIFMGPDLTSQKVYVVFQHRTKKPGEVKVVLGCTSGDEALMVYHRRYRSPKSIKSVECWTLDKFMVELKTRWSAK